MRPKISVVVPTYNRLELLKKCVASILSQTFKDYELIIINDGSDDGTEVFLKKLSENKSIISLNQKNKGFGNARNTGFEVARGDIIASTDDDCVVEDRWLEKIYQRFESRQDIAAVGGSINNPSVSRISWAQYILNYSSWFPSGKQRFIMDIPTANIAYRKSMVKGMKFISKDKRAGYSDTLFNQNVRKYVGKILYDPDIRVHHYRWDIKQPGRLEKREYLKIQHRRAFGFMLGGYKVHGIIGELLLKIRLLNYFCPRLLLVSWRCLKAGFLKKFIWTFPLLVRGELEFGIILNKASFINSKL